MLFNWLCILINIKNGKFNKTVYTSASAGVGLNIAASQCSTSSIDQSSSSSGKRIIIKGFKESFKINNAEEEGEFSNTVLTSRFKNDNSFYDDLESSLVESSEDALKPVPIVLDKGEITLEESSKGKGKVKEKFIEQGNFEIKYIKEGEKKTTSFYEN
jgi:hypothetical protein